MKKTFIDLKTYLTKITGKHINPSEGIVINYLTAFPKHTAGGPSKSTWNIYDRDYLKKLHKITPLSQLWIYSLETENLNFHHYPKINWVKDSEGVLKTLFFPIEVPDGNFSVDKTRRKILLLLG